MPITDGWNYNNTYGTASSWYTTRTAPSDSQTYYTIGPDGEAVLMDMGHQHQLNHENLSVDWSPQPAGISVGGEEVIKFKDDLEFKVNGKWVSVKNLMERLDKMEKIVDILCSSLPQWKIDMIDNEINEDIEEGVEHIDPDLFKV